MFGFFNCHFCRKVDSCDELVKCSVEDCNQYFCYKCIRKCCLVSELSNIYYENIIKCGPSLNEIPALIITSKLAILVYFLLIN